MPLSYWVDKDIKLVILNISKQSKETVYRNLNVVAHIFSPATKEGEGGELPCIQGQPGLQSGLSQIKQNNTRKLKEHLRPLSHCTEHISKKVKIIREPNENSDVESQQLRWEFH